MEFYIVLMAIITTICLGAIIFFTGYLRHRNKRNRKADMPWYDIGSPELKAGDGRLEISKRNFLANAHKKEERQFEITDWDGH